MDVGRTVLALLVALSVAMLPTVGTAGVAVKSMDMAHASAADDMDCCPGKTSPDKAMDDCCSMATCALKCFAFPGTTFSNVAFPMFAASPGPPVGGNPTASQTGSPPFRPPRV